MDKTWAHLQLLLREIIQLHLEPEGLLGHRLVSRVVILNTEDILIVGVNTGNR